MALVYIVEDDRNIREIETFALRNTGYEVMGFECAKDFYKEMENRKPDIILLDIMLPDEDGLEIVRKLRAIAGTRGIPVIMVTAKASEIDKVKGLDMGADDYMTKPFGVMELISRVKALLRRSSAGEEKSLHIGSVCLDIEKHSVTVDGVLCELTYKEYELLRLLMNRAGIVTSRDMILERVWGTDFEGESRTLDMHIKTLRRKLNGAGAMIKTIRNVGYMFAV
ncbi:MAG: response regulator transcription factor [Lachnospiraceae bacterium]|jgi:two-component system alkaline phosphatase synthesis response regulator PhoP|nr:response regulator transcription factor [Lachnospiraceae bacterium]